MAKTWMKKDVSKSKSPLSLVASWGEMCRSCHYFQIGRTKVQTSYNPVPFGNFISTIDGIIDFMQKSRAKFIAAALKHHKDKISDREDSISSWIEAEKSGKDYTSQKKHVQKEIDASKKFIEQYEKQ